jgi:flavin-dependent dehydrogenase
MSWDAIVVGAGPAGCTAAILLAREGLRVILVDKSAALPSKVCGEYLSPGCLRILDRIGALPLVQEAGARPLSGMVIHTAAGRALRATYPGGRALGSSRVDALAIRRARLDPILLDLALQGGVQYMPHFQVSDLLWENQRIVGVRGRHRGGSASLLGRLTIGADGRHSVVARRLGTVSRHPWLDKVALVAYATGVSRAEDVGEIFLGRDQYCILNPIAPDLTNIGFVINRCEFQRPTDPAAFPGQVGATLPGLADRLADARVVAPPRRLGPLAHQAGRFTAPGALLVGDAAGFLDPFTGEGIHAALRSAVLAVESSLPALRDSSAPPPEPRDYAVAWRQELRAKWRLCSALQWVIRHPLVAEGLVTLLARRPDLTALLMAVVGDLLPVHALHPLGLLTRVLGGGWSIGTCPEVR